MPLSDEKITEHLDALKNGVASWGKTADSAYSALYSEAENLFHSKKYPAARELLEKMTTPLKERIVEQALHGKKDMKPYLLTNILKLDEQIKASLSGRALTSTSMFDSVALEKKRSSQRVNIGIISQPNLLLPQEVITHSRKLTLFPVMRASLLNEVMNNDLLKIIASYDDPKALPIEIFKKPVSGVGAYSLMQILSGDEMIYGKTTEYAFKQKNNVDGYYNFYFYKNPPEDNAEGYKEGSGGVWTIPIDLNIVIYSLYDEDSFKNAIDIIKSNSKYQKNTILVGNKSDRQHEISINVVKSIVAEENLTNIPCAFVSCITKDGIDTLNNMIIEWANKHFKREAKPQPKDNPICSIM